MSEYGLGESEMDHLATSFAVVFPLFAKLAIGYTLKRTRVMGAEASRDMNAIVFKLLLPLLLFSNIYNTDLSRALNGKLILFAIGSLAFMFILSMTFVPRMEKANNRRGVLVQAICRSNFIIFGLPVATTLHGQESAAAASLLVGVVVPFVNMISIIALEYYRGGRPDLLKTFKAILVNPITIGASAGLFFVITGWHLPLLLEELVSDIAGLATPFALMILGGSVSFESTIANRRSLMLGIGTRLILVPLLGIPAAILAGFQGAELVILMAMFASPAAVASYTMARQMGGDADLAGQLVVYSTVLSIPTIFLWTYLLSSFSFI